MDDARTLSSKYSDLLRSRARSSTNHRSVDDMGIVERRVDRNDMERWKQRRFALAGATPDLGDIITAYGHDLSKPDSATGLKKR